MARIGPFWTAIWFGTIKGFRVKVSSCKTQELAQLLEKDDLLSNLSGHFSHCFETNAFLVNINPFEWIWIFMYPNNLNLLFRPSSPLTLFETILHCLLSKQYLKNFYRRQRISIFIKTENVQKTFKIRYNNVKV